MGLVVDIVLRVH